jgi:hypothetical protein
MSKMQSYLQSQGDERDVLNGPGVAARPFVSKEGKGRVWSGDPAEYPGMRFYGTDKPRKRPTPEPLPTGGSTPMETQHPEATPNPTTMPVPLPVVGGAEDAAGGFDLAAFLGDALKALGTGLSEGPACALGGDC